MSSPASSRVHRHASVDEYRKRSTRGHGERGDLQRGLIAGGGRGQFRGTAGLHIERGLGREHGEDRQADRCAELLRAGENPCCESSRIGLAAIECNALQRRHADTEPDGNHHGRGYEVGKVSAVRVDRSAEQQQADRSDRE